MIRVLTFWFMVLRPHVGLIGSVLALILLQSAAAVADHEPLSSRTELEALFQLRASLGLRENEWSRGVDPCTYWVGVECRRGRVTGIDVSGLKRTHVASMRTMSAVHSLANFTFLASFNSSGVILSGEIPHWFGNRLRALQVLDLSSSSVFGPIPPSLGSLSKLKRLYLSNNSLSGAVPDAFGQLLALSVLDLAGNSLGGLIPTTISSLRKLSYLDLSSNYLHGPIPPGFGDLYSLQFMDLSDNDLSGLIPSQIGNLSQLVELDLSKNLLSGYLPDEFRELRSLRKLVLDNNFVGGPLPSEFFSSFPHLELVVLEGNEFNGTIPEELWMLPNLRYIDLSKNKFVGVLPNFTSNVKASDAVFNLSNNMFYGRLNFSFGALSKIDLSGNYLQGEVPNDKNAIITKNCFMNVSNQRGSEECRQFYANRNVAFYNFVEANASKPLLRKPFHENDKRWVIKLVGLCGGTAFLVLLLFVLLLLRRKSNNDGAIPRNVGPFPEGSMLALKKHTDLSSVGVSFSYELLLRSTENFSRANLLKHGHSGDIFRGTLEGGIHIVVKRIDLNYHKKDSCILELELFSKASHAGLVPLLGHCLERESERLLVYKYIPNGDLSNSLYRPSGLRDNGLESLDWITRMKIAIGAAEVLSYLHHECSPPLVHRDVQASSILLDKKFVVRLGSLSSICAQEGDTQTRAVTKMLWVPPTSEYNPGSSPASSSYDVYCFGKVLLQLVTGKLGITKADDIAAKQWLEQILPYISRYDKELLNTIIDPSLVVHEDLLEEIWAMAIVARACLNPRPAKRPMMKHILKALENPLKVVRDDNPISARFRANTSTRSWSAAFFGSWRQSSSESSNFPVPTITEGASCSKQAGSQGNGANECPFYIKRSSNNEIFPEPSDLPGAGRHEKH